MIAGMLQIIFAVIALSLISIKGIVLPLPKSCR